MPETASSSQIQTVALAGNPNSGKTTLFNALTNLRQKVANYPGVTVEKKMGKAVLPDGRAIHVLDLPGTYSLLVRSQDEQIARDVLMGRVPDTPAPDLVICVVDAGNLERHLYLVSQIQDLGYPVILALNMMDELARKGKEIDAALLSRRLGFPVVPMVASQGQGLLALKETMMQSPRPRPAERAWKLPLALEEEILKVTQALQSEGLSEPQAFSQAVFLFSQEKSFADRPTHISGDAKTRQLVSDAVRRLSAQGLRVNSTIIEARYAWIKNVLNGVFVDNNRMSEDLTTKIDSILTHKVWGWLFFVSIMGLMFFLIFTIATYPMAWIDHFFAWLSSVAMARLPPNDFRDLLTQGVIGGVGGVVIFLPQILILFFFIGLMQDTGYMARAAFIMDRVMSKVGLHGKSFIPLLCSFACAIPGIMASRTIESTKDRLVTILIAPLMSCSARLPVYALMIAVCLPEASAFQKAGLMVGLYFLGMTGACMMAWIFKKAILKKQKPLFIMELPPYRFPSVKTILFQTWERTQMFLRRAGTTILALSIILWALMSYPKAPDMTAAEALKSSLAGRAGQFLEPAIAPLGYDWRIGIGLLGSLAAREVFVSTMSIVFNLEEDAAAGSLQEAFRAAVWPDGRPLFTPLVCLGLMVFYVFALQCTSTIAIVYKEINSWRWSAFQFIYMTLLAYGLALAVVQGGRWLGFQ